MKKLFAERNEIYVIREINGVDLIVYKGDNYRDAYKIYDSYEDSRIESLWFDWLGRHTSTFVTKRKEVA